LATQPLALALQRQGRAPGVVLLGEDDAAHAGLCRAHARDQRDAVHHAVRAAVRDGLHRQGAARAGQAAQVGVDEQHVVAAALRGCAVETAQRGGAAARGGDLHVGLGGERRGQRLGEDAVIVHDQHSDANHETPTDPENPEEPGERETTRVRRPGTRQPHGRRRADTATPLDGRRTRLRLAPLKRTPAPTGVALRVRTGAGRGRPFSELVTGRVYGVPHVSS
jgi:hypothetical protein